MKDYQAVLDDYESQYKKWTVRQSGTVKQIVSDIWREPYLVGAWQSALLFMILIAAHSGHRVFTN